MAPGHLNAHGVGAIVVTTVLARPPQAIRHFVPETGPSGKRRGAETACP